MSLIQKKNCGICRLELTPDDFYEIISIPLFGVIQDVHIQCMDSLPDIKDQMQIFDQETFKQLEKEKENWKTQADVLGTELERVLENAVKLTAEKLEIQEKIEKFRIFNQFIVEKYEIIGVIQNVQKQHGTLKINQLEIPLIENPHVSSSSKNVQILIDQNFFPWNSSYLIHLVNVAHSDFNGQKFFSFRFGFQNRQNGKIRFILEFDKETNKITPLSDFQNYTKISFGNHGYTWFNSLKYYPLVEVLVDDGYNNFEIKIDYEEFLNLSAFRNENPDLFTTKKKRFNRVRSIFQRKKKT